MEQAALTSIEADVLYITETIIVWKNGNSSAVQLHTLIKIFFYVRGLHRSLQASAISCQGGIAEVFDTLYDS